MAGKRWCVTDKSLPVGVTQTSLRATDEICWTPHLESCVWQQIIGGAFGLVPLGLESLRMFVLFPFEFWDCLEQLFTLRPFDFTQN